MNLKPPEPEVDILALIRRFGGQPMTDAELNEAVHRIVFEKRTKSKLVVINIPNYLSPDWSGVRMVCERMEALGWDGFESRRVLNSWRVSFWRGGGKLEDACAATLPRAACEAALKALEK